MKPTEEIFLNIAEKSGIKTTYVSKADLKALGEDTVNNNLFFFLVMEQLMNDDTMTSEKVGDCDPDSRQSGTWLEPEFNYCDDWIEFYHLELQYNIKNKTVEINYRSGDDWLELELTDDHYEILTYLAEGWRDYLNEQAKCYTGNAMRDCGHRYSDFI